MNANRVGRGVVSKAALLPADDVVERIAADLLDERSSLHELILRHGPIAGVGLSNVLTGFRLGRVDRREVHSFVRENLRVPSAARDMRRR